MEKLRLAVPGTLEEVKYANQVVRIQRFVNSVDVISSKQRPRKVILSFYCRVQNVV